MYILNMIMDNLINNKLSYNEIGIVLDGLIDDNDQCPCRILDRECDKCQYKSIDQDKENRSYSGCVDAIEYYTVRSTLTYNYPYIIKDGRTDKRKTWSEILYYSLFRALIEYPEYRKKIKEEWEF